MPTGEIVDYTAYTKLYYVANVEDSTYQYLNIFVPASADGHSPIFMRNYVGDYMASQAGDINPGDASGRTLLEGYVVVIPGARGRNSVVKGPDGSDVYTGRAPAAILDLKAAVRYLRHYDDVIPGDSERIISDGTSAGGTMSALLGATGNNPDYEPYLKAMGAFDGRLLNPMSYIGAPRTDTTRNWYIRHGSKDSDTTFLVPVNLATRLQNTGKNVDFKLTWNRPHSGDYALNELFAWIDSILK